MNKLRIAALAVPFLLAACGQAPAEAPRPVKAELLFAALDASQQAAASVAPRKESAAGAGKALAGADRLVGTVSRLDPARIDPRLAERLITR